MEDAMRDHIDPRPILEITAWLCGYVGLLGLAWLALGSVGT